MTGAGWENGVDARRTGVMASETVVVSKEMDRTHTHFSWLPHCKFKTFGLLQPCFGHLSCMPVVCVTHYKLQRNASYLNQSV